MELDQRLRQQLTERISLILQAVNSFGFGGIAETLKANQERGAILAHIAEELDYLEGIETVYRALLNRQTITAIENQANIRGYQRSQQLAPVDTQAIEETR